MTRKAETRSSNDKGLNYLSILGLALLSPGQDQRLRQEKRIKNKDQKDKTRNDGSRTTSRIICGLGTCLVAFSRCLATFRLSWCSYTHLGQVQAQSQHCLFHGKNKFSNKIFPSLLMEQCHVFLLAISNVVTVQLSFVDSQLAALMGNLS